MSNTSFVNPYAPGQVQKKPDEMPELVEPIVIAAFIIGLISLFVGISNFVNGTVRGEITKEKLKEMLEKLDSLLKGQTEIVGLLQIIFHEIKWSEILIQMSDAVSNINYQYDAMLTLEEGDNAGATAWANAVLAESNGLTKDLFVINDVVMGQTIFNPALMQIFAQRVTASSSTQSQYYDAVTFFRDVLLIEAKGMCALANAYTYMNSNWDPKDFTAKWKAVLDTQASYSKQFLDPLNQFYSNPAWGNGYFALIGGNQFVDTNENVAKEGELNVVVGLALYLKGNRLGLKVLHAAIDAQGLVDQTSSQWRDSPGWGEAYFDVKPNHWVDTNVTVVPSGNIATGAQLYLKGNRVAIRLQSVPYDPKTGKADFSRKQWTDSPGWGDNFYDLNAAGYYVNTWPVQPSPLSFVTAVALFQFGNRMALKQNTVFYVL